MKYEIITEYSNTQFRRITGVKRATFEKMVEILQGAYAKKHRRRGRTPKLSIEDLLLAALEYLREYRTINEQIQKGHKDALQERIEASKGKLEPKPQVKKR